MHEHARDVTRTRRGKAARDRSEPRRRIRRIVGLIGGASVDDLRAACGTGWSSIHHHVDLLVKAGIVHTEREGRRRLVLDAAHRHRPPAPFPSGQTFLRVARAITLDGARQVAAVARQLDVSTRVARHHVHALVRMGLVNVVPARPAVLRSSGSLVELLAAPLCPPASAVERGDPLA